MCLKVHSLLRSGEFGDCSGALQTYEHNCHELFPLATAFKSLTVKREAAVAPDGPPCAKQEVGETDVSGD